MSRSDVFLLLIAAVFGTLTSMPASAQERVDTGRSLRSDAFVKVWNGGGSVRVIGWDRDSVAVTGTVPPRSGRFFLVGNEEAMKLGLEAPPGKGSADLVVRVPMTATVWVRTASANVEVRGMARAVDVHTVSGAIDIQGRTNRVFAESMGGDIRLRVTSETARGSTGTGLLDFRGSVEDLTLSTVEGELTVETLGLRRGRFSTVSGGVRYKGGVEKAGSLAFETHGGDVELWLNSSLDADFELSTIKGQVSAGFGERWSTRTLGGMRTHTFQTGAGSSDVGVRTFSGSITVRQLRRSAGAGRRS